MFFELPGCDELLLHRPLLTGPPAYAPVVRTILIRNATQVVTMATGADPSAGDFSDPGAIPDAAIGITDDVIAAVGPEADVRAALAVHSTR